MRTNVIGYVLGSENRIKIVRKLLEYPGRQWSCSFLEDLTGLSHATVYRTIQRLLSYKLLTSVKTNRRDVLYILVMDSLLLKELAKSFDIDQITAKTVANMFAKNVPKKGIESIILYGSTVKGNRTLDSDIDILIIVTKK